MTDTKFSRRSLLVGGSACMGTALAMTSIPMAGALAAQEQNSAPEGPFPGDDTRARRMQWWHAAKFGMFIHFGVYSAIGRHEWAMEDEAIPVNEYEKHAAQFNPAPGSARTWAKLAKQTGMKYVVLTTKHHEGFCNFDSKLTNYNAVKLGPKRDVVREYVEALREEGLRVGFYYSLMDWHHPDGARCATDEAARQRFVEYTHGLIRELMTNYGKIDVLWYDVSWPLDAKGWESVRMNKMVYELQPDIIINNRNKLPGDFSTPEQRIVAETGGRAWESCMTLNDSWGYQRGDDNWKSPKTVIRNLVQCVRDGGNYLINIGPKPDGSVPPETVKIFTEVGQWMSASGDSLIKSDVCQPRRSNYASFTRTSNTLYMHVHFWPGDYVAIAGLTNKVISAKFLHSGKPVQFEQDALRVRFINLPKEAPDHPVTTLAIECDSEPHQDTDMVRKNRLRENA